MGYQANFTGWQHITLEDFIFAYLKVVLGNLRD